MTEISKSIIEKFLLPNPQWQDGFKSYSQCLGSAVTWLMLIEDDGNRVIKLGRKGERSSRAHKSSNGSDYSPWIKEHAEKTLEHLEEKDKAFIFSSGIKQQKVLVSMIRHFGRPKALLFCCGLKDNEKVHEFAKLFFHFLASQVEFAYKNYELNNFYETVHPRALALSTMHSVHRVISSSLRLKELLPRIGRLSAQVLKTKGCSIMLVDPNHEFLVPAFSFGQHPRFVHKQRIRVGRGLQGHIAETGEFHLSKKSIAIPFIEDDIVGVISLWEKIDNQPFSKTDLEILKSISEQAVVAIKNAQLFEETEQLTIGSIKTINDLLELNFGGDRSQLPIFGEIVMETGKELQMSSSELVNLERAILLLDTGALALPEKILQKKGKLTKKEFNQIKRIPSRGANLLRSISSLGPVIPIILHHHERYDGKGYPQGLMEEEIPIGARIVSVVNSFVAMISKRTYRKQLSINEALQEIEYHRGTQFDPRVVDCFKKVLKRKEILDRVCKNSRASR